MNNSVAEYEERPTPSFFLQFAAAMRKNFLLKVRSPISTCVEAFLPALFVLGLIGIWSATDNSVYDAKTFVPVNESVGYQSTSNFSRMVCTNSSTLVIPGAPPCFPTYSLAELTCPPQAKGDLCFLNSYSGLVWTFVNSLYPRAPATLDEMILYQWMARVAIPFDMSENYGTVFSAIYRSGFVHFTPPGTVTDDLIAYLNTRSALFQYAQGLSFPTHEIANGYTSSVDQEGKTWAIVNIESMTTSQFSVTLQLNRSGVPWTNRVQDRFESGGTGKATNRNYHASGFLTLQKVISEYYLDRVVTIPQPNPAIITTMPYTSYKGSTFLQLAGTLAPLIVVMAYLYPVSQVTKGIVVEKETRVREAMLIMGMGTGSFYTSWVLLYVILNILTSVLCTILFAVSFVTKGSALIIFFLFFFFGLSTISFAGVLSAMFSKARIAALLAPLIYFIVAIPMFAISDAPAAVLVPVSLLSPSAFAHGLRLLFDYEISTGMGSSDFGSPLDEMNMAVVFVMLLLDTVLYLLLMLYFDAVLPSEWGTRKHPLFPFVWIYRTVSGREEQFEYMADGRDVQGTFEDMTSDSKQTVRIEGLRKSFSRGAESFVAVNNLYLGLYENQISVLLGHNGAGKTTTVNLMTGMLETDGGDCTIYGKSVRRDLHGVRQEIGFCPQHNILWADLTCKEHLEYFASLKGLTGAARDAAVKEMISAVDLGDKAGTYAGNLSGGQKRKLSVALAFVGGSRMIFLDEPTAGMDVAARRHTWDLLRRMTAGRTIVLTTHYMDEADLLGNTIAIMSKGRLKCLGTSLFLKSRLGVGYTLVASVDQHRSGSNQSYKALVSRSVQNSELLTDNGGEIAFRLPFGSVPQFPALLEELEINGGTMGVSSYGISVTTLEEIFIKIGNDEDLAVGSPPTTPQTASVQMHGDGSNSPARDDLALWSPAQRSTGEISYTDQFVSLVVKRFQNAKRDRRTICFQIVTPVLCIIFAMLLTLIKFPNSPRLVLQPEMYGTAMSTPISNCPVGYPNYFRPIVAVTNVPALGSAVNMSNYLLATYKSHSATRSTALYCGDTSYYGTPADFWFINTSGTHSAPEALASHYEVYLRNTFADNTRRFSVASRPLDLSKRESKFIESITTLIVGIFIMIPFTFIPSTFVSWVVKERECGAKHLQTISGMNYWVYWISNFVFDSFSFLITEFITIIVFLIFGRDEYIGDGETFAGVFVLFLLYGLSGICGSYLCNFAFDVHSTAQNIVMLANFVAGFLLVLLSWNLNTIPSTQSVGEVLQFFFRLVPSFCLGDGIINLASRSFFATLNDDQGVFDLKVIGWDLIYMAIEFPLFFGLTLLIDHPSRRMRSQRLFHKADVLPAPIPNEDDDVLAERMQVENNGAEGNLVTVRNLCKVYPTPLGPKVAVKNLSFGVRRGEVFGFLGTNGAGKTTTISVLCGEILPTYGHAWVAGHDVVGDAQKARQSVGYCPQFDALFDLLTPEEHIRLYAGLRGLPKGVLNNVVEELLHKCGLDEHRGKLAMNLSGGNKRKLSVALAFVGGPEVLFLDEPSAGMDPRARHDLWSAISAASAQCSVVLTTHHLEEVEALSNRVAIMVDGEMKCIGSLNHLKTKFGTGFEMSVRVNDETRVAGLEIFIAQRIPHAALKEQRNQKLTFSLPQNTRLSQVFAQIEESKSVLGVTDYSISQTSLEQVFLSISAMALHNE